MTSATDALARARAELAAAEEMGSPEVDVALAAVEQAEQAVMDEGRAHEPYLLFKDPDDDSRVYECSCGVEFTSVGLNDRDCPDRI